MLLVSLLVNSRLSVVKFGGSHKLEVDFQLHGRLTLLISALLKGKLYWQDSTQGPKDLRNYQSPGPQQRPAVDLEPWYTLQWVGGGEGRCPLHIFQKCRASANKILSKKAQHSSKKDATSGLSVVDQPQSLVSLTTKAAKKSFSGSYCSLPPTPHSLLLCIPE